MTEFEDAEHDQLMHAIAARLGFDLLSVRLELFARKRVATDDRPSGKARATAAADSAPRAPR